MSIFKTEDCPICGNKTNAFQKTITRYNGKFVCKTCVSTLLKAGVNAWEIKKKSLIELQQLIGLTLSDTDCLQDSEKVVFVEAKKTVNLEKNEVAGKIKDGQSYHLEDTNHAIDFYEDYLEFIEKQYGNIKQTLKYDIKALYAFQLDQVNYECKGSYNALYIHYSPYAGALVSKLMIIHFDKKELKKIEQLTTYLNELIALKHQYDEAEKYKKEQEEYERVHGKHRYSKSKFAFIDDEYYLKYSYYDVEVRGVEYGDFDISTIPIDKALYFEFAPDNAYDKNAIRVLYNNCFIGYVPKNNLQKMMKDFYEDDHGQVRGFISRVDEHSKKIYMGLGFYKELTDEELKQLPHVDVSLTKTSKKDFFGISRQENLDSVSEGDEIYMDYQYDTETYLITDDFGNELGEINTNKSEQLQAYEDEGKEFYGVILEIGYSDSGKNTCKVRIFIREE